MLVPCHTTISLGQGSACTDTTQGEVNPTCVVPGPDAIVVQHERVPGGFDSGGLLPRAGDTLRVVALQQAWQPGGRLPLAAAQQLHQPVPARAQHSPGVKPCHMGSHDVLWSLHSPVYSLELCML